MLESVFIKLQASNFPVNFLKFLRTIFFNKKPPVAASEKFMNFSGKHQWRRRSRFIFLINMTE